MQPTLSSMKLLLGLALGLSFLPFGVLAAKETKLANRTIERVSVSYNLFVMRDRMWLLHECYGF